ncbi:MAG TPA: BON domain-containing protein [Gemmatimonadaceae bacterium]|nr:BON domain-containing protein [Gemmatimonadaceae bacterium]
MNRINAFAVATVLAFATACSNTAKGVEKDAENATENAAATTEKAAESTAAATADAGNGVASGLNTADVKAALLVDTRITAAGINVESDDATKTLSLNGTVPNADSKRIAEEVAKAKAPEYKVINNLTVKP